MNRRLTFPARALAGAVRILFRAYFSVIHRATVKGRENIPECPERLVIVSNHGSLFDGPLLWALLPLRFRTLVSRRIADKPLIKSLLTDALVVRVETLDTHALRHVLAQVERGEPLLVFPEGRRSTSGGIMKVYEGAGFITYKTGAAILPVYIENNCRIGLSRAPGRKRYFSRLTVHIGKLVPPFELGSLPVRQRRTEAATRIYELLSLTRFTAADIRTTLASEFIRLCRYYRRNEAFKDITLKDVRYGRALAGAFALGAYCARFPDRNIGVLLPNLSATAVLFFGLQLQRKVPAFLNYAGGPAALRHMLELADLGVVITSREFLARIGLSEELFAGRQLVYLEDIRSALGLRDRLAAAWKSRFPGRWYRAGSGESGHTAVILFTSGSEGVPKGVPLSHRNILANIHQCLARIDVSERDYLLNALPVFHSFGLTVGVLMPLFAGGKVFLYVSPLHYRVVPETAYREDCTILLGTSVFLRGYGRRAHPYDFRTLRYVYCGAEALQEPVFERYARVYGKRILTGYGATECSPVVSMNNAVENEHGSAGKLLPGMEYRVQPVEGLDPKGGRAGQLLVRGPNVMSGYLRNAEADRKAFPEPGWYDTGDIVEVSETGFLTIIGRRKRFAKVSGEMVSLGALEDALSGAFGARRETAVIALPDPRRGERIVLVVNHTDITLEKARSMLRDRGFSELSLPRDVLYVEHIPRLGTGKIDYPRLMVFLIERSAVPLSAR